VRSTPSDWLAYEASTMATRLSYYIMQHTYIPECVLDGMFRVKGECVTLKISAKTGVYEEVDVYMECGFQHRAGKCARACCAGKWCRGIDGAANCSKMTAIDHGSVQYHVLELQT